MARLNSTQACHKLQHILLEMALLKPKKRVRVLNLHINT